MITTDEELRQAYLSYTRDALPDGHLDSEQLWRLAAGELEASASRALIDHISNCPSCAEDFRLTRRLVSEASGEVESAAPPMSEDVSAGVSAADRSVVPFPRRTGSGRWWRNLAAAAALVVAVGGLSWQLVQPEDVVYRQGSEELVRSLVTADVIALRHDAELRWSGPEGAVYDVLVTTAGLRVVFEVEGLAATELLIPESHLTELPAGTLLHWHVEAVLPDGSRIPSESFDLRLADE